MSKEDWFAHYEEVLADHPEMTEDEAVAMAFDRQRDAYAAAVDHAKDEARDQWRRTAEVIVYGKKEERL